MILDEILANKRLEVAERKARRPIEAVRSAAGAAPAPLDFKAALSGPGVAIIAEVKRASPSAGALRVAVDAADLASRYAQAGATAISVLTDERYFEGRDEDLVAVRRHVAMPILRKEFIVDPYQVYESRALGADAILLIVGALEPEELVDLFGLSQELGLAALVEIHTEEELEPAWQVGAEIIGINNRDLRRMVVDLDTTRRLRPLVPPGRLVVAESGILGPADIRAMASAGADAVLVGSALVRAPDPGGLLREMVHAGHATSWRG